MCGPVSTLVVCLQGLRLDTSRIWMVKYELSYQISDDNACKVVQYWNL